MPHLLLIDDDESNRITLSALLADEGFDVREARSCTEATRLLREGGPVDIVLLDQHLGDGLGANLVPIIRLRHPRSKIALMSGGFEDEDFPAGIDACFPKGEEFSTLLRSIEMMLLDACSIC